MKLKTRFTDAEIAHVWVNRGAPIGSTPVSTLMDGGRGSRQSFDGDAFSSYTTVIARRISHRGRVAYILDAASFGPTTAKHLRGVRDAIADGVKVFTVYEGERYQTLNLTPADLCRHYLAIWDKAAEPSRYAHIRAERFLARYRGLDNAIDVCRFFGLPLARLIRMQVKAQAEQAAAVEVVETKRAIQTARREARWVARREASKRADARAEIEAIQLAEAIRDGVNLPESMHVFGWDLRRLESRPDLQALIRQRVAEREAATVSDWLAGKPAIPKSDWPTLLRAEQDEMVTTKGARVPLTDAKRAYTFAMRLRAKGWHRNGEQFKVGMYDLDAINEQGIVAGCHRVTWAEVERFAALMGWTPAPVAA